jgi:hypothetical protein
MLQFIALPEQPGKQLGSLFLKGNNLVIARSQSAPCPWADYEQYFLPDRQ